jgi:hypothetical protein
MAGLPTVLADVVGVPWDAATSPALVDERGVAARAFGLPLHAAIIIAAAAVVTNGNSEFFKTGGFTGGCCASRLYFGAVLRLWLRR